MSARPYEQLLRTAFPAPAEAARFLPESNLSAYVTFERAAGPERAFRFERVRLGVAMALLTLLAHLGDHEESRKVAEVLLKALAAKSVADIDATITRDAKLFEKLYTNLYVNDDGELLLGLFERTLDADSRELMDEVIAEALAVATDLDFSHHDEEDEDEDEDEK